MWLEFPFPLPSDALTILDPHALHCSPPAFHAFTASFVRTVATPSPLCFDSFLCGVSRPAVKNTLSPM